MGSGSIAEALESGLGNLIRIAVPAILFEPFALSVDFGWV